ncbi:MAG: hypothetical protein G01um101419_559 [Parcubacteria group bacterium Gr01-1014_19]|nr:MAG: hypothetical protein G01um101419_559 [Parcubacteria group bacterium Gr01-1014_19]
MEDSNAKKVDLTRTPVDQECWDWMEEEHATDLHTKLVEAAVAENRQLTKLEVQENYALELAECKAAWESKPEAERKQLEEKRRLKKQKAFQKDDSLETGMADKLGLVPCAQCGQKRIPHKWRRTRFSKESGQSEIVTKTVTIKGVKQEVEIWGGNFYGWEPKEGEAGPFTIVFLCSDDPGRKTKGCGTLYKEALPRDHDQHLVQKPYGDLMEVRRMMARSAGAAEKLEKFPMMKDAWEFLLGAGAGSIKSQVIAKAKKLGRPLTLDEVRVEFKDEIVAVRRVKSNEKRMTERDQKRKDEELERKLRLQEMANKAVRRKTAVGRGLLGKD